MISKSCLSKAASLSLELWRRRRDRSARPCRRTVRDVNGGVPQPRRATGARVDSERNDHLAAVIKLERSEVRGLRRARVAPHPALDAEAALGRGCTHLAMTT